LAFVLKSLHVPPLSFGVRQAREAWELLLVLAFMVGFGCSLLWIGSAYLR